MTINIFIIELRANGHRTTILKNAMWAIRKNKQAKSRKIRSLDRNILVSPASSASKLYKFFFTSFSIVTWERWYLFHDQINVQIILSVTMFITSLEP
jgi:hypothetical protein